MDMLTTIASLIRAGVSLKLGDDGQVELVGDAEALPEELLEALEWHREALADCLSVSLSDIAWAETRFADGGLRECLRFFEEKARQGLLASFRGSASIEQAPTWTKECDCA